MLRSGEWVRERRACESLERGRVSPEGASSPRARRSFARGGIQPSSEAEFFPRWCLDLEQGGVSSEGASSPRARRSSGGTALSPSSEEEFHPRGAGADRLMGRLGCHGCGLLSLGRVICEKWVFPGYQGTLMAVPDSSPRASAVVSVRSPQRLMLADGTFFPPGRCVVPWGHASAPAGVVPEALQERGCTCKVFSQRLPVREVLVSTGIGNVSAGLGGAVRTY
jgi:hypothetical protein